MPSSTTNESWHGEGISYVSVDQDGTVHYTDPHFDSRDIRNRELTPAFECGIEHLLKQGEA